jgi:conserved oligomeric Golgi complex subunit 5
MVDPKLGVMVAKNVAKTLQLMAVKAEQLIASDGDASQVIGKTHLNRWTWRIALIRFTLEGPPTRAQKTNAGVVNWLHHFDRSLRRCLLCLTDLPSDCHTTIVNSLQCVHQLQTNAVQPLLSSISDAVEAILLTMHDEDFTA